jgi:hypothetical protein
VTGDRAAEPTLAEVQEEFPGWRCSEGPNRLCYARHDATGTRVAGEDPLDLRDQIRGAQARLGWGMPVPGQPAPGGGGEQ